MFPPPLFLFSQLFVFSSLSRMSLSQSHVLFSVFSSASEKQKLIKYGTRWSSISLNHHVIKMASLGDQLKRSRRTMSPQSDIYGHGYVNMLPLFAMYISCNYHFLQLSPLEICGGKKLLGECHQRRLLLQSCCDATQGRKLHLHPGEIFYLYLTSLYRNHQCLHKRRRKKRKKSPDPTFHSLQLPIFNKHYRMLQYFVLLPACI